MATVKLDVLTVARKVKKQTVIYIEYFSRPVQFYNSVSSGSSISSIVDTERLLVTYQRIIGILGWMGYQNATTDEIFFSLDDGSRGHVFDILNILFLCSYCYSSCFRPEHLARQAGLLGVQRISPKEERWLRFSSVWRI